MKVNRVKVSFGGTETFGEEVAIGGHVTRIERERERKRAKIQEECDKKRDLEV